MAKTKADYQAERRAKTATSAIALIDDLSFFRELLGRQVLTSGDIRRASAQLRRILVEDDLGKIASPRTGKVTVLAPNHLPFLDVNKAQKYLVFSLGHVSLLGVELAAVGAIDGTADDSTIRPQSYDQEARHSLALSAFLTQPSIAIDGEWYSRREIIKYAANVASGVHSGERLDPRQERLQKRRYAISFSGSESLTIRVVLQGLGDDVPDVVIQDGIDVVLLELLAAMSHLTSSPDVLKLEQSIKAEFGL